MIHDIMLLILAVMVIVGIILYIYLVLRLDKIEKRIHQDDYQPDPGDSDIDELFGPDPRTRACDRCSEYTLQLAYVEISSDINNTYTEQLCLDCLKDALDNRTI